MPWIESHFNIYPHNSMKERGKIYLALNGAYRVNGDNGSNVVNLMVSTAWATRLPESVPVWTRQPKDTSMS